MALTIDPQFSRELGRLFRSPYFFPEDYRQIVEKQREKGKVLQEAAQAENWEDLSPWAQSVLRKAQESLNT